MSIASRFFDAAPTPSAAPTAPSATPTEIVAPSAAAPDLSQFFIFAPTAATTVKQPTSAAPHATAGIPYGSHSPEPWSETIELDPADVTPCPTCNGLEFWINAKDEELCMRCQPLKIQRFRNWMNRREMLLTIHQQQREEQERHDRAQADDPSAETLPPAED